MATTAIPNQPIKFWDAFDTAKLECEKFSKPFCLKFKDTDNIRFVIDAATRSGTQLYNNEDFSSGIVGWSQADGDGTTPNAWIDTTCEAELAVTSATGDDTKWLYQSISINSAKCYELCVVTCDGTPAQTSDSLEVGYESGGVWNVLATEPNILTGNTYCFELDLSALTTPPYNIGIRFTGAGANSFFLTSLTLTEYTCGVDIVDCDCDVVSDTILPTNYDATSGQYLYDFNADTLGLADGVYRIKDATLGCSNCFEINSSLGCEYWLFSIGGNSDSALGIDWSLFGADEYFQIRVANPELRNASYDDEESVIYRDSSFTNKLVYGNKNKTFDLILPKLPEYVHDTFAIMASISEYFSITIDGNERRFRVLSDGYGLTWTRDSDLATGTLKVVEYQQPSMINQNTANM